MLMFGALAFFDKKMQQNIRGYIAVDKTGKVAGWFYRNYPLIRLAVIILIFTAYIDFGPRIIGIQNVDVLGTYAELPLIFSFFLYIIGFSLTSFEKRSVIKCEVYYVCEVRRKKNEFFRLFRGNGG